MIPLRENIPEGRTPVMVLGFWFNPQLLSGTASLGAPFAAGGLGWAHVGGFLEGIILVHFLALEPPRRSGANWRVVYE